MLAVLAAATAGQPRAARAGVCCVLPLTVGVGLLKPDEPFAVGLGGSISKQAGLWLPDGTWLPYDSYSVEQAMGKLWAQVRVLDGLSAYARLPVLVTRKTAAATGEDTGGGLADAQAGLRYELVGAGDMAGIPAVAVMAGLVIPTGTRLADLEGFGLGAGTTARGVWSPGLAVDLAESFSPWCVRGSLAVAVPLPDERPDMGGATVRYGVNVTGSLVAGVQVLSGLGVGLLVRANYEAPYTKDGTVREDSSKLYPAAGLAVAWAPHPRWALQASVTSGLFVDDFAHNALGRVAGTVGLRYGHRAE